MLRSTTFGLSLAMHLGFAAWLAYVPPAGGALEGGTGDDQFVIEQGVAIEGISTWGTDTTNISAVEAEPLEASQAREAVKAVEPVEEVEETRVIASEAGPEQEVPEVKPEPVEQPVQEQVATLEQVEQTQVEEKRAAGAAQTGGSVTERNAYLGKLRSHLEKRKLNPRSRSVGTVIVRFTVDRTGNLLTREVATSSGNSVLDNAALSSIERAAPFPAMPETIAEGPLVVTVPFRFTVR
ncbi:MAG: energy transducer TonB [Hyphomicrobium sp.]|nr:energy transducer TonB [Hyphomicrobium sp.]